MQNLKSKNLYQFVVELEAEKLASAKTLEEQLYFRNIFSSLRYATFLMEWESFNTTA